MKKNVLILGGLFLIIILGGLLVEIFFVKISAHAELRIMPGMSFNEIVDKLKSEHLIRSKTIFEIYSFIIGKAHQFKPGRYFLTKDFSLSELVGILIKGPQQVSVTITPGLTLKEVDKKLSSLNIIKAGELTNFNVKILKNNYPWLDGADSLEGFLLPDTYRFFVGSDSLEVVKKILDNFQLKALPLLGKDDSLLKTTTLASLLEKEVPDSQEKKMVAGILIKRLKAAMPLQVDAGIVYAKCNGWFLNCPPLKEADYKIDSAYNTYLFTGLPKGPIDNPSLESIKAAISPEKSDYWYYLSDPKTGKTIFSKTLDDHNKKRVIYLLKK